jgi:hypothetical protein
MSYKWIIIIGVSIGILIGCWYFRCMEFAEERVDSMTAYQQLLKNPTAAGKK